MTNQRETTLAWERKSGKPLGPAVVWQCHRSADFCRQLEQRDLEAFLRQRTGLTIDPMFSGSKMRWLLDHIPDGQPRAEDGEICLGTVDSWILWNLTSGASFACDFTNASRTQLFNLHDLDWDDQILEIFGIPRAALPQPSVSSAVFGETQPSGALPGGLPIASLIGDSTRRIVWSRRLSTWSDQGYLRHRDFTDNSHLRIDPLCTWAFDNHCLE